MNPYGPMFTNLTDQVVTWFLGALFLLALTYLMRLRFGSSSVPGERWCASAGASMLVLNGLIGANYLFGYIFLVILQIETFLWVFWQLAYLMSVIIAFWMIPVVLVILTGWATAGMKCGYSRQTLSMALLNWPAIGINAILNFAINYFALD